MKQKHIDSLKEIYRNNLASKILIALSIVAKEHSLAGGDTDVAISKVFELASYHAVDAGQ